MNDQTAPLDPFSADAVLDGVARYEGDPLSTLLDTMQMPALPSELAGESAALDQMEAVMPAAIELARLSAAAKAPSDGTGTERNRRMSTRAGALAVAGSLLFTGVAAAAAGVPVPVVSEVVPEIELPSLDGPELTPQQADEEPETLPFADGDEAEGETEAAEDDAHTGNSEAAQSDCGKKDAEPTGDEDCDGAVNHGAYVSKQAHEKNAEKAEAKAAEKTERAEAKAAEKTEKAEAKAAEQTEKAEARAESKANKGGKGGQGS